MYYSAKLINNQESLVFELFKRNEMKEKEKMVKGLAYKASDPELIQWRMEVRKMLSQYNLGSLNEPQDQEVLIREILPNLGNNSQIEPPFYCDYGWNIFTGDDFYMNFDCIILDVAPVHIGNRVLCGPKVQILTATHSLNSHERYNLGTELGKPVTIGNEVWIGAGTIICPGVQIGDQVVIGAGSIVTRNIPSRVFAAGNPCKVIKEID